MDCKKGVAVHIGLVTAIIAMTIRKAIYLFWTTIVIGAVVSLLAGFVLNLLTDSDGIGWLGDLGGGIMFGAVAQMGFFAYMIFNWLGASFLRNRKLFLGLQVLLMVFVLSAVLYSRYTLYGENSVATYLAAPLLVLLVAIVVAKIKVSQTNSQAWIPTLFFMIVATMLEAGPAIKQPNLGMLLWMVVTLLACNAWQVLQLHRLVDTKKPKGS